MHHSAEGQDVQGFDGFETFKVFGIKKQPSTWRTSTDGDLIYSAT